MVKGREEDGREEDDGGYLGGRRFGFDEKEIWEKMAKYREEEGDFFCSELAKNKPNK